MNIEHIRTFLEVSVAGSFHAASERLNVSQSTVSARIKNLETILGRKLFERDQHGAVLTEAGKLLLPDAEETVRSWQRAREQVSLESGGRQSFGVGLAIPICHSIVYDLIGRAREREPDTTLRVLVDFSAGLNDALRDGLIDMAMLWYPNRTPGVIVQPLVTEKLLLAYSVEHTDQSDWADNYIEVDWGYEFGEDRHRAFPNLGTPNLTVAFEEIAIRLMLKSGGASYLSERALTPLLEAGKCALVQGKPEFVRTTYVACVDNVSNPALAQEIIDHARFVLGATNTSMA